MSSAAIGAEEALDVCSEMLEQNWRILGRRHKIPSSSPLRFANFLVVLPGCFVRRRAFL
jgi:hypothetical protein